MYSSLPPSSVFVGVVGGEETDPLPWAWYILASSWPLPIFFLKRILLLPNQFETCCRGHTLALCCFLIPRDGATLPAIAPQGSGKRAEERKRGGKKKKEEQQAVYLPLCDMRIMVLQWLHGVSHQNFEKFFAFWHCYSRLDFTVHLCFSTLPNYVWQKKIRRPFGLSIAYL